MSKGIFGGLFDFNHDGKVSGFERAAELGFLHDLMESEKKSTNAASTGLFSCSSSFSDEESDDRSLDLMIAGLDEDELRWMDDFERRETLEGAGLDPADYDYLDF